MIKLALKVVRLMFTHSTSDRIWAETTLAHKTSFREAGSPNKSVSTVTKGVLKLSLELLATLETSKLEGLQQLLEKKLEDIREILKQR